MTTTADKSIEFLKGVGPQRAELLQKELNIFTFKDLLHHFPFRYQNRLEFHQVVDLTTSEYAIQVIGTLSLIREVGAGRSKRMYARFSDSSGAIELVWFQGIQWIKPLLIPGEKYLLYGKARLFGSNWHVAHPELTPFKEIDKRVGYQPIYSSTEKLTAKGLHSRGIERLVQNLWTIISNEIQETLPQYLLEENHLLGAKEAFQKVHFPNNEQEFHEARKRLKFEELLLLQLELNLKKVRLKQETAGWVFEQVGDVFTTFYEHYLPFPLTEAQKRVIREIRKDLRSGKHMNRLLQGDVGSGKTVVSLLVALIGIGNGFQAAIMAPTEILATQHFIGMQELLKNMNVEVALLTGSTKIKERRRIHEGLQKGGIQLLVGTHALLEDVVQFNSLGVVIIDEQHRFGVAQRAKMWKKNTIPPHVLVMTATPIPRTLAMTFYGDLDVSVIDELPPGRKPIQTIHRFEGHRLRLFQFMRDEIALGRQVYIVYPLIEESKKMDYMNLMSGFESISRAFPLPQYAISIVHGQLSAADKEYEMQRFVKGETQIMVATTVIEVGVNVPNASVMIIESAERFGLSQLHQLRGRVGRGAEKSYCILMTGDKLSKEAKKRMATMVNSNDGFEIAEVDLQLRGPGDLMGTQQSGVLDLKIANLSKDGPLITLARDLAIQILEKDPQLIQSENSLLRATMIEVLKTKPNWGKFS
ncbi:MAG: ATP-dependent helicase RecG [Bacteroidota bacterium]|jgi:ATP-dependent DNA helicase RecG